MRDIVNERGNPLQPQQPKKWKTNAKSDGNATLYALGKINSTTVPIRLIFLLILFHLPCLSHSQNYVLNVTGKVIVNEQSVKNGDKLDDNQKIFFGSKATMTVLTKSAGKCVIPEKSYEYESVLSELITATIESKTNGIISKATGIILKIWEDSKRELAFLGTRSLGKEEQVKLKSLCKILYVTPNNVNEMFSQYIWNYCVDEFKKPDWSAIALHLNKEYGFDNVHIVEPLPVFDAMKRMEGYFSLMLEDGTPIPLEGDDEVFRNFELTSIERMTYNTFKSYFAGKKFHIICKSPTPAYIYLIATDSEHSPPAFFPNPEQKTARIDFKSELSIPTQMDKKSEEDYWCIVYSKEELNIEALIKSLKNNSGKSFVKTAMGFLAEKMVDENEVKYEKNEIAFIAESEKHTVVPIFIRFKHR